MATHPNRGLAALVFIAAAALCGCPNPNSYGTPRTTPPGKISHSIAIEGYGYAGPTGVTDNPNTEEDESTVGGFLPTLPSYQIRIGVAEPFDIGVHLHNLTSFGADFKFNPVRGVGGGIFDFAIDPAIQYIYFSVNNTSFHIAYFHAPLMFGINATDWFTIVLTPGITYGLIAGDGQLAGENSATYADGVIFRGTVGFQFRVSKGFAIHPEFSLMKGLAAGNNAGTVYTAGIGFNFGTLPGYEDRAGEPEGPVQPGPGPAPGPGAAPAPGPAAPAPAPAPAPAAPAPAPPG
jgi:hypothetical protein